MTSQLAAQLQKLQVRPESDKRLSESFLFSKSDARSFSREQIHQLATSGLQTLVTMDNRFHPFISDLFDPQKTRQERKLLTNDESRRLDMKIEHFMTLLSPHLFLTAAQQVFEYLVRVHEVHVYNVQAVLRAFLPYHDHNIFARAVLLLDLRDSGFDFLSKNQEHGAALPREHLVIACADSRKALRLVCMTAAMPVRLGVQNNAANALFASVATALATYPDAEALWRVLLPFVVEFLHGGASSSSTLSTDQHDGSAGVAEEQQHQWWHEDTGNSAPGAGAVGMNREAICTSLLVLAAWSGEATFSLQMLKTVMKPILALLRSPATVSGADARTFASSLAASSSAAVPLADLLTLLDVLFSTQFSTVLEVGFVPLLNTLVAAPWPQWCGELSETFFPEAARAGVAPLAALQTALLGVALERLRKAHSLASVSAEVLAFLRCAAERLPLTDALVESFLQTVIQSEEALSGKASTESTFFNDVVGAMERRYQRVFDATLSKALSGDAATAEAAKGFLARHLDGTRYQMLEVSSSSFSAGGGARTERLPLFACLLHTVPEVRRAAAATLASMTLEQLCSSTTAGSGGSILELLAHAARSEADAATADQFLQSAAAALRLLQAALTESDKPKNEAEGEGVRTTAFHLAAVNGLLRALYVMVSALDTSTQQTYFQIILLPLLQHTAGAAGKKKKGTASSSPTPAHASAVYYATLTYVGAATALPSDAEVPAEGEEEEKGSKAALQSFVSAMSTELLKMFPDLAKTASILQPAVRSTTASAAANDRKTSDSSSDSDNEEEDDEEAMNGTNVDNNTNKKRATTGTTDGQLLAVLENEALLETIQPMARERLPLALEAARTVLKDEAATPAECQRASVESTVASAATLTTADAQAQLLAFLIGSSNSSTREGEEKGYLQTLQAAQRAQARQAVSSGEVKGAVGRSAKNSVLSAAYLPANTFTQRLAAAVQAVVKLVLQRPSSSSSSSATDLVPLLQLLGYLGAPLPTLMTNMEALPVALLDLLDAPAAVALSGGREDNEEADGCFRVDWYALVHDAIYGAPNMNNRSNTNGKTVVFSLGALAACLLLPLRAPASQRVKCLQQLQDAVLRGATGTGAKANSCPSSSVHAVAAAALTQKARGLPPMDITALSSIVEAMSKEESRFSVTGSGAELLSALLAATAEGSARQSIVPYQLATEAVEFFFAVPDSGSLGKRASLSLRTLWPRLEQMLTAAAGPRSSKSVRKQQEADSEVSPAAAAFLEAVCRRCTLQPSATTTTTSSSSSSSALAEDPAVRLCALLLQRPYLRVAGAGVRPVYRAALTAFAVALQQGLESATQNKLIFKKTSGGASSSGKQKDIESGQFAEQLAAYIAPTALKAVSLVGLDVATLCVGTVGGYHRLFQPFLQRCTAAGGLSEADSEVLLTFLEALAPQHARRHRAAAASTLWSPPTECIASNPLTFVDALAIIKAARPASEATSTSKAKGKGKGKGKEEGAAAAGAWTRTPTSLQSVRLLSALLRAAPTVRYDDDEEDESLLVLANAVLTECPLEQMLPLLVPGKEAAAAQQLSSVSSVAALATLEGGSSLLDVYPRQVLSFLRDLTLLCVEQPHALAEKDPRGPYKLRGTVLKQALVLMASLLLKDGEGEQQGGRKAEEDAKEDSEGEDMSRSKVDIIAELLRTLAPLLGPLQATATTRSAKAKAKAAAAAAGGAGQSSFLLHIPIAALLVRLGSVEFSEALRYRSAADTCREIITSFDVHTQISTITQLMRLVVDPHTQLADSNNTNTDSKDDDQEADAREVLHLFRKMVKPNQITNRQEQLLDVITTTVKSDAFLGPFIHLQHHSSGGRSGKKAGAAVGKNGKEDGEGDDESDPTATGGEAEAAQKGNEGTNASDACMQLLLAALEMFSHYGDLNSATANDIATSAASSATGAIFGEQKSYAKLLELLAGNALACVLAGINEPTFVECQLRLLGDSRTTLQVKGLEVLLDRLHHSLPTVENTLSDEELEQHRKDLRDPKKKLTLADLVRVKARPLTTKRSFQLMDDLTTLLGAAQSGAVATIKKTATTLTPAVPVVALTQLCRIAQLSVACVEELVRIVASGGSTQAEKTLLNTNRGKRVNEAQLAKLFGNKMRVDAVHQFVKTACESGMPGLSQSLQGLLRSARRASFGASPEAGEQQQQSLYAFKAAAEEGLIAVMSGLLTALGTMTQVMGTAFSTLHCIPLLNTVVSAAMFQVADLPAIVARGGAGSLLRHTTLSGLVRIFPSCWQLSQPYLPRIIFAATHASNVDDAETSYLSSEVLAVLEALMEPQLFLEATTDCLRGMAYTNTAVTPNGAVATTGSSSSSSSPSASARTVRVQAATHSFVLLFGCVARRVQNLKREELLLMPVMTDGATAQDNFWLAALQSLAGTATAAPTAEVVQPVLDAYIVFFLKFKPKHCTKFLRIVAEWAFGGDAAKLGKSLKAKSATITTASSSSSAEDAIGNGESVPRTVLHGWLLFYALYNHLLEKLGSILDFSFATALPYIVGTLNGYCAAGAGGEGGGAKQLGSLVALVLDGALNSVRRMSLGQTPGPDYDYSIPLDVFFATEEVFSALMPALVHQLTNLTYLADEVHDYSYRAEHAVVPAVRAFFACLNASKLQSKTQAELLRALRHPSRLVRRAALLCLDGIYADGGEELASRLMAEMLPAVVELTEDRDEAVVEEARKLCTNLSHMTGQDVLHAMS